MATVRLGQVPDPGKPIIDMREEEVIEYLKKYGDEMKDNIDFPC